MRVSPEIAPGFTTVRVGAIYIIELAAIAFIYFWLVKLGLTLASINPSASPVWPATGFALDRLARNAPTKIAGQTR